MILIFFLCLKLSILHLCVSNPGYHCNQDGKGDSRKIEIYLVEENKSDVAFGYQYEFNTAFIGHCRDYYELHKGPLKQGITFDNIVHFAVPHYYNEKPPNNFVYAGTISKNNNNDTCSITTDNKKQAVYDCHEFANLVSESLYNLYDRHLYNFILAMDYKDEDHVELTKSISCEPLRNASDLNVVILCLPWQQSSDREVGFFKDLKLIQVPDDNCPRYLEYRDQYLPRDDDNLYYEAEYLIYNNRLLAVLAPDSVRERIPPSLVPAIFYQTPYMYSETKTDFPNSMNLVPWRLLKYGFLKFIQTVGWQRVAIVSDDSEYSVAFEDELTALFRKEKGIVHTVIRCEYAKCNMSETARELKEAAAWIIIANVEEENARMLITNTDHRFTWLLRDLNGKIEVPANHHAAFSFSLQIDTKKDCGVEDNILTGLSGIALAYENTKKYASKLKKREFYRKFTHELQRVTPKITEPDIVIHRLPKFNPKVISRMSVNANGITKEHYFDKDLFPKGKPNDGTAHCLVTTYDYYKPCEDHSVLFLMFTLMMFVLTILLITCYFDKTSPFNDVRYQHF